MRVQPALIPTPAPEVDVPEGLWKLERVFQILKTVVEEVGLWGTQLGVLAENSQPQRPEDSKCTGAPGWGRQQRVQTSVGSLGNWVTMKWPVGGRTA